MEAMLHRMEAMLQRRRIRPFAFRPTVFLLGLGLVAAAGPSADHALGAPSPAGSAEASGSGILLHTELRETRPAADSVVEDVREVLLVFTTPVPVQLSRVTVMGPDEAPVAGSELRHPDPESTDRLVMEFPAPLPPGRYEVRWGTTAPDGHAVSGSFSFTVTEEAATEPLPPAPEPAPPVPDAVPPADEGIVAPLGAVPTGTGQRWLHLLGTILLLGVVTFRFAVLDPVARKGGFEAVRTRAEGALRRFAWVAGVVLLVTLVTRLEHQLRELGGGDELAWQFLGFLLFRTGWGAGWGLHLAALVLLVIGLVLSRRVGAEARGWSILAGAAILLPLVPALQGHAMGSELRTMTVPVMYVHVAAASAWLGGLVMLVLVGLPSVRKLPDSAGSKPPLARVVDAFSRVGLVCVTILVIAGLTTSYLYGIEPADLVGTAWGRTLALKLAIAGAAFLLGFYNWRRVRPSLEANPDPGALRIPATLEAILGIVVLLVTAALVATPLP
jgi:copper transport protein